MGAGLGLFKPTWFPSLLASCTFGIPLQGSILTTLFLLSLNPVPLILTLLHLAGHLRLGMLLARLPISYLRLPPADECFFFLLSVDRLLVSCIAWLLCDVMISGMSVGFSSLLSSMLLIPDSSSSSGHFSSMISLWARRIFSTRSPVSTSQRSIYFFNQINLSLV